MGRVRREVKWTRDDLNRAVLNVRTQVLSLRKASKVFNVPVRTIRDHLKADLRESPGRPAIFDRAEESGLTARLKRLAKIGYGVTIPEIRKLVFEFCKKNGKTTPFKNGQAGKKWLRGFLKRNPDLSVRQAEKLNFARGQKMNRSTVGEYIGLLTERMTELGITDKPERVFNADESGVQLTMGKAPRVIACKGDKRVYQQVPAEKAETVSIMVAGNALGSYITPMVVYKGARMQPQYGVNLPAGSKVAVSESGYFNSSLFVQWLDHFDRFKPSGKVLLVVDGHRSHVSEDVADKADELEVELLCLPSNTTHELQPLDRTFFGPFKHFFNEEFQTHLRTHPGQSLRKGSSFESVLSPAFSRAAKPSNLVNGFRSTGLFPPSIAAIDDEAFAAAEVSERRLDPEALPAALERIIEEECEDAAETPETPQMLYDVEEPLKTPPRSGEEVTSDVREGADPTVDGGSGGANSHLELSTVTFEELLATPKSKRGPQKRKSFNSSAIVVKRRIFECASKKQKEGSGDKKGKGKTNEKQMSKKMEPQPSSSDTVRCIYCSMQFQLSCEQWIRCNMCNGWACVPCTDAHRHQKGWICDMCRP